MTEGFNQSDEQKRQQQQGNASTGQGSQYATESEGRYDAEDSQDALNRRSGDEGSNVGQGGMNQQSDVGQPGYGSAGQGGMTGGQGSAGSAAGGSFQNQNDQSSGAGSSGGMFQGSDSEPALRTMGDGNPEHIGIPGKKDDFNDDSDNQGMTATGGMPNVDR